MVNRKAVGFRALLVLSVASMASSCSSRVSSERGLSSTHPRQTEVSPAERDDGQSDPKVAFNHLYVVVPAEVIEQFSTSEVLRDRLAASDQGFPKFKPVELNSQSIYLRGENTYLEIFGPNNRFGTPVGKLGLAFSTETAGEIDQVEKRLREASDRKRHNSHGRPPAGWQRHLQAWDFDRESPVNWYHVVLRSFVAEDRFNWWFSEFHQDFLPALYPARSTTATGIKRSQFLAGRHDPSRWLRDIVSLVVVLPPDVADDLVADISAVGGTVEQQADGGRKLSLDSDFQLVLYAHGKDNSLGLRSIGFTTLPQTDGPMRFEFPGSVSLELDGGKMGSLVFAPSTKSEGN